MVQARGIRPALVRDRFALGATGLTRVGAGASRCRCERTKTAHMCRVGSRVSQADFRATQRRVGAGTLAKRFIAATSDHAFELCEPARTFRAARRMGGETAASRRGCASVRAQPACPAAAPAAASRHMGAGGFGRAHSASACSPERVCVRGRFVNGARRSGAVGARAHRSVRGPLISHAHLSSGRMRR